MSGSHGTAECSEAGAAPVAVAPPVFQEECGAASVGGSGKRPTMGWKIC